MTKILIVYYSLYGHIHKMAEAVAMGVRDIAFTNHVMLAEPDYRVRIFPSLALTPLRTWDQAVGLPVTMLGALRAQLAVLDGLINEARSYGLDFARVEPTLQGLLRRSFVALAHQRHRRAPRWPAGGGQ